MKKFVIGDIRGDLSLLKSLLDKISPLPTDQMIFTGSYMGPGANSKGVVDHLLHLNKTFPHMVFLRGCYEFMFEACVESRPTIQAMSLWGTMQGGKVFKSYNASQKLIYIKPTLPEGFGHFSLPVEIPLKIPASHIDFLQKLVHWYEYGPYVVTHSGGHPVLFGRELLRPEETVFAEKDWWEQDGRMIPGKEVIFSHQPFREPFRRAGKIGIDLGAGFGGKLCAFELESEKFTMVEK